MCLKWVTLADLEAPPSLAEDSNVKLPRLRGETLSKHDEETDPDEGARDEPAHVKIISCITGG